MVNLDEDALELAFWTFDEERRRSGAERDAFKHQMRQYTRNHMARLEELLAEAEIYVRAYKTQHDAPKGIEGASRFLRKLGDTIGV